MCLCLCVRPCVCARRVRMLFFAPPQLRKYLCRAVFVFMFFFRLRVFSPRVTRMRASACWCACVVSARSREGRRRRGGVDVLPVTHPSPPLLSSLSEIFKFEELGRLLLSGVGGRVRVCVCVGGGFAAGRLDGMDGFCWDVPPPSLEPRPPRPSPSHRKKIPPA